METKHSAKFYEPQGSDTLESHFVFNHFSVCRKLESTFNLTFFISCLMKAAQGNIFVVLFFLFVFLRLGGRCPLCFYFYLNWS